MLKRAIYGAVPTKSVAFKAARDGKITRAELKCAAITITSLGPLGGPVTTRSGQRRPKQDHRTTRRAWRSGGGMNLFSSFDHRIIDGADAAEFIQKVRAMLQHLVSLFI
jgi:2-oxoisovalerate dehydrogenase E2 component (dihydrolipoyl transacylase)